MRYVAALAPLAIFAIDRLPTRGLAPVVLALLDEPAHLATAAVCLAALRPPVARPFATAALLGAVAIDIDHLPALLGTAVLTQGTGRPYSHSLLTIGLLRLGAAVLPVRWRPAAAGATFGMATHFLRDLTTPIGDTPGLALFWPFSPRGVRAGYGLYAALLVVAAVLALWHARSRPG